MITYIKRAITVKKLNKCRIELGGVQAEISAIDKIVSAVGKVNYVQMDKLQASYKRAGELQAEISIYESKLRALDSKNECSRVIG
jgi:hypothetical protein